ncbi:MAG: Small-conductance mechanosensitive channel MscMJ [Candidatus Methanofastidiosum methylothiophilum]|uniref:Small-conductance mechanosensitive channel MscMJ n=1 Tax=Candidatus Methanofastidiosum methylothiophilum TaxID=1705564 RepID=A0A150JAM8_9EURY|nr:MAG: Small-conductance mechanosensitive channel MscMJ [Candidatus Methanofastidiosum methylthiophilus]OQC51703.1 MAG: Small-conductance mechanosensitive channel MscMJ [Euryarchaeota archaeon ADurb.Bin023]HNZ60704.1 mechanosensitive ion channel family protein [Methanofastidiosum sp.]KYC56049.1 MAG: Small-conductance mechanosensitive channel MscMJ [Candidatus Methanofastidiosum methylthiophilus]KYC56935.1 MAG: Small-conductance mechanosensitive channel MscMJ [Candidatus Methanofastidiosum meth
MNLEQILNILLNTFRNIKAEKIFPFILAVGIIISSIIIAKGTSMLLKKYLRDKFDKDRLGILLKGSYYGIIALAVILSLPILGIDTSGFLVAGGITGIVIGFASQNIVGNLISGLFIMAERPIKIGSQVEIDQITGFVEDIGIMSTVLRNFDGLYVRIPNEKVFTNNIINRGINVARRVERTIGIRYSDDTNKAIDIIYGVIEDHPFILKKPNSDIYIDEIKDGSVNIMIRVWTPSELWYTTKRELLLEVKNALEKEGILVSIPYRVVWFANDRSNNNSN